MQTNPTERRGRFARRVTAWALCGLALAWAPAGPAQAADNAAAQARPTPPAISAEFPYESRFATVHGSQMHYVEQGAGEPILLLHGNPTSSYLWRNVIPYLSGSGRVIAVDNIGFGKSDKPDLAYSFADHARYIDGFIDALGLTNITLVVHDWGSVLGLHYAVRNEANVKAVAFMEAIIPPAFPMKSLEDFGPYADTFRTFRDPAEGPKMLVEQNFFIEQLLPAAVMRPLTEPEMAAYRAPFTDRAARKPILVWPNQLPIAGHPAATAETVQTIGAWLATSDTPKLLQYASPGALIPPEAAAWMAANYRNLETQFVGYGIHYIQEDNPEAIGRGLADWLRRVAQ